MAGIIPTPFLTHTEIDFRNSDYKIETMFESRTLEQYLFPITQRLSKISVSRRQFLFPRTGMLLQKLTNNPFSYLPSGALMSNVNCSFLKHDLKHLRA